MSGRLQARFLESVPSSEGKLAIVLLIEPNGDEYAVRCLCKPDGTTDVGEVGNGENMRYFVEKYREQGVIDLLREVTLGAA